MSYSTTAATGLPLGKWAMLTITYDGSTLLFYLNGAQVKSATQSNIWFSDLVGTDNVTVGALKTTSASGFFDGRIDELAVFTDVLTAGEIAYLYDAQSSMYAGYYDSDIFDANASVAWNTFSWIPQQPFFKELPNSKAVETAYTAGNVDMSTNAVLYHLNETGTSYADNSGDSYTLTCPATCPTYISNGRFSGAQDFNGSTMLLRNTGLTLGGSEYTLMAWVNPDTVTGLHNIIHYSNTVDGRVLGLRLYDSSGSDVLVFFDGTAARISSSALSWEGIWSHVAVTISNISDGNADYVLYIDGQFSASSTAAYSPTTGGDALVIGGNSNLSTQWFDGKIDEVGVFTSALSASSINNIYRRGANRLRFQVRSCDDSACSGELFVGSSGTTTSTMSELTSVVTTTPSATITSLVSSNRYFQYRTWFESSTTTANPELLSVSVVQATSTPTASSISPAQTSATEVTLTTTIADYDLDTTSLIAEYSLDNSTWVSSTLGTVIETSGEGTVTTSTGQISSIDTNVDGAVNLSLVWNIVADIPNTDDTTVYFRLIPNDGTSNGSTVSSTAFAVDTKDPTVPSALAVNTTSTASVILILPTTTSTDTNFTEYKIFYSTTTPVLTSDSAMTSSTDANLGNSNFNGATTTTISSLDINTQYYVTIYAYDSWGHSTSTASELSLYTLAVTPGTPIMTALTTSTGQFNITVSDNPSNTEYAICMTVNGTSCVSSNHYVASNGTIGVSAVWQTHTNWGGASGLVIGGGSPNTAYQFLTIARNGGNVATTFSSPNALAYSYANSAGTPTVASPTTSTLDITIVEDSNPTTVTYAIYNDTSGTYVAANGSSTGSAVYQTTSTWGGTITATGLTMNTAYQFRIVSRNSDGLNSATSTASTAVYTLANSAGTPTIGTPTATTLPITIDVNGNSSATTYAVYNSTDGNYLDTVGSATTTAVYSTTSTLGSSFSATGLSLNTAYQFMVIARNADGVDSATSTASTATYTLVNSAGTPTVASPTTSTLGITIATNSNPASVTYAIYNQTDGNYLSANGSSNGATPIYQTTSTWGSSVTATGLSVNTTYQFTVISRNAGSVASATSTASTAVYTLANAPSAPTIGTPTATTLPLTINVNNNPAGTTYAVYNVTSATFLDALGATSGSAVYSTTSTLGSSFSATSLTPNTAYTFSVIARNGDSTDTATSSASSAVYTLASVPSSLAVSVVSDTELTLSWSGDGTSYTVENVTASTSASGILTTSKAYTGLICGTTYSFHVKALNVDNAESAFSSSISGTTSVCVTESLSSGFLPPSPPVFSVPPAKIPSVSKIISAPKGVATKVTFGSSAHMVTVLNVSPTWARVKVESDPIILDIAVNGVKDIDTNRDGFDDVRVAYLGDVAGIPKIVLLNLTDPDEEFAPISINAGRYDTRTHTVRLLLNAKQVSQIAVSNRSDLADASFVPFTPQMDWTLASGTGEKTVYVALLTEAGGKAIVSDSITVVSSDAVNSDTICPLTIGSSYKTKKNPSVYMITEAHNSDGSIRTDIPCTKRAFTRSQIFFTYFKSWSDVIIVDPDIVQSIPNDALGFMPWGPLYDPQYGAIVKIVSDPKVYLLLNDTKYWITSESVFNALQYAWHWIEDISVNLLEKYKTGSEISDTRHHPNYTLIKYANSPAVYRLEPSSFNIGETVKRYIVNEKAFNKLHFRWDRIVTISDAESYPDGVDLR